MRKMVLKLGVLFLLPFCFSCTEEDFVYKGDADLIVFGESSGVFKVREEKVKNEMEVLVAATRLSDVDREVIVQVVASETPGRMDAVQGTHYDIPDPIVVIPAGQWSGTLKVVGYFQYLPPQEDRVLNLRISDAASLEMGMNTTYSLFLTKRCEFDMADFQGTFRFVESVFGFTDAWNEPIDEIEVTFAAGGKPNEFIIRAPYGRGGGDVTVVAEKNEATGDYELKVPDQFALFMRDGTSDKFEMFIVGKGTWDACTKELELLVSFHDEGFTRKTEVLPERFIKK